ncbi:MAG: hypothetical protein WC807_20385 [Hyphomicrobium sp.]|jgi:hypothetical protein
MTATPKALLIALDRLTAPVGAAALFAPQMLSPMAARHVERVRSVFDDPNIVGAGIAPKVSDGEDLGELSLVFYVREKRPRADVEPAAMIPPVVEGGGGKAVFTDVVEIGDVVPELNFGQPPLRCGFSVSHVKGTAGTLGALVFKRRKLYILSNSHVLAQSGLANAGDAIIYPGPSDDGADPEDVVARLDTFTPFEVDAGFVNAADAALAEVLEPHAGTAVPELFGAHLPLKIANPVRGMRVIKRGRTTGDTESVVRDVDFRIFVAYPEVGQVGFAGQVRCDRYTDGGDSGALVIEKESGSIVGLHFAGSGASSIFTPIRTVMKALRFRF